MRDPRLGAFGVVALVLLQLADAALLRPVGVRRALPALIVAGAVSRLAMVPGTPHLYECVVPCSRERRICTNAYFPAAGNAAFV